MTEGLHLVLSGKLNRLARKTKGYSNSVEMLRIRSHWFACD